MMPSPAQDVWLVHLLHLIVDILVFFIDGWILTISLHEEVLKTRYTAVNLCTIPCSLPNKMDEQHLFKGIIVIKSGECVTI